MFAVNLLDDGCIAATARRPHKLFKVRAPFGGKQFPLTIMYNIHIYPQLCLVSMLTVGPTVHTPRLSTANETFFNFVLALPAQATAVSIEQRELTAGNFKVR
jgi:hypothetical protein